MNRMKLTLLMGACFLLCCLAGKTNMSEAADKKTKKETPLLTTCVCNQVPLGPVGTNLWAWMAYRYQYEDDCAAATAVSIINYAPLDSYPETLCVGSGACGDTCSQARKDKQKKSKGTEPAFRHYMHPLPARPSARLDLYPPETDFHYEVVSTRFMQFGTAAPDLKCAKLFLICLSKSENPTDQSDAIYFWYGFEVEKFDKSQDKTSIKLPFGYCERRAPYHIEDRSGGWSAGVCREFSLINYGGSQYLIRFNH